MFSLKKRRLEWFRVGMESGGHGAYSSLQYWKSFHLDEE